MSVSDTSPIFVLGRQHSGNTLLVSALDNLPGVLGLKGEGTFFEDWAELERLGAEERVRRLADILGRSDAPHLDAAARAELERALLDHCRSRPPGADLSARALYAHGMNYLASRRGKRRWAQKATSYIFYVEAIWRAFPEARLIYLLRNPLDLAASLKLRREQNALLRMTYGWKKGLRLAAGYEARRPDRFRLVRFEDLVGAPEPTVRQVLDFCGLEFHPACLQVPRVNPAEDPYRMESAERGMDPTRLFRYRQILAPAEEAAVRWSLPQALVESRYPELRSAGGTRAGSLPRALWLLARSAAALAAEQLGRLFTHPGHTVERLRRRLT